MEVREQVTKSRFGRGNSKGGGLRWEPVLGDGGAYKDKPVGRCGWTGLSTGIVVLGWRVGLVGKSHSLRKYLAFPLGERKAAGRV